MSPPSLWPRRGSSGVRVAAGGAGAALSRAAGAWGRGGEAPLPACVVTDGGEVGETKSLDQLMARGGPHPLAAPARRGGRLTHPRQVDGDGAGVWRGQGHDVAPGPP